MSTVKYERNAFVFNLLPHVTFCELPLDLFHTVGVVSSCIVWEGSDGSNLHRRVNGMDSIYWTFYKLKRFIMWAPSSEFVSSSIPSLQILTAHAQPFRGARDLAFCLKVPLDSLLVWASSEGSGETARMRRLAWTFAARIGDKYQIR